MVGSGLDNLILPTLPKACSFSLGGVGLLAHPHNQRMPSLDPVDESFFASAPSRYTHAWTIARPASEVWAKLTGDNPLHVLHHEKPTFRCSAASPRTTSSSPTATATAAAAPPGRSRWRRRRWGNSVGRSTNRFSGGSSPTRGIASTQPDAVLSLLRVHGMPIVGERGVLGTVTGT